jgi:thioredoxin 1
MRNILFVFTTLFFFACESGQSQNQGVKKLDVNAFEQQLKQYKSKLDFQLVDVRTPEEYNANHLAGALNIDYNGEAFEQMLQSLDKNKPVLVYCLVGGRSGKAAKALESKGFKEIYDMQGGMSAWKGSNKPYEALIKKKGISEVEFKQMLATDKLVLVDFNAKWCAPCQKMLPMVTALAEQHKDKISLLKIDYDENEDIVKALNVSEIPLLLFYKNGNIIWQKTGLTEQSELEKIIANH